MTTKNRGDVKADTETKKGKVIGPGLEALGGHFTSKLVSFVSPDCVAMR